MDKIVDAAVRELNRWYDYYMNGTEQKVRVYHPARVFKAIVDVAILDMEG